MNALDAAVQAYNNISTLRQHFGPGDRVHGVIDEGGLAPNIIPAYTRSRWIVRAETNERFDELMAKVLNCFEAAAKATGCELDITTDGEAHQDLVSNSLLAETFAANAKALGREMPMFSESGERTYASSDMGNVSHLLASIHPSVAIETDAINHQPDFAAATVTPSGEKALRDGALAMAHTIIDLAENDLWDQL